MNIIYADGNVLGNEPHCFDPSGLHFRALHLEHDGHYMELTELHPRTVAPILHISAYSSVCWQQGLDIMIKEKKGIS
jgi:hypothetical protein